MDEKSKRPPFSRLHHYLLRVPSHFSLRLFRARIYERYLHERAGGKKTHVQHADGPFGSGPVISEMSCQEVGLDAAVHVGADIFATIMTSIATTITPPLSTPFQPPIMSNQLNDPLCICI